MLRRRSCVVLSCFKKPIIELTRNLMLQESHGMKILEKYNIATPKFSIARTPDEAAKCAIEISENEMIIKAQVLAGGRAKGRFDSGLKGGIQVVSSPEEAKQKASQMIGSRLITKQTDTNGRICNEVMVTQRLSIRSEYYFSITLDGKFDGPILIGSKRGGVNIEQIAKEDPTSIITMPVDIVRGLQMKDAEHIVKKIGFSDSSSSQAVDIITKLYDMFIKSDCSLIEINPIAEDDNGNVYCLDCKVLLDDNASFRQKELFALANTNPEDEREARASQARLNYIRLFGNIGCVVNGAGLAMATMDIIKLEGGDPANFLDIGGSATAEQITEAFRIMASDPHVSAVLVNIFGGIIRCDVIAQGIINAFNELKLEIPIVCRLQGTRVNEAKLLIESNQVKIVACDNLGDAAKMVVKLSNVQNLCPQLRQRNADSF